MTSKEFFNKYYFHDCDVLNMILCGDILTTYFILDPEFNGYEAEDISLYLYVEVQFKHIQNFKTSKLGYKIVNGKREYLLKGCQFDEACIDGKNANELNDILLNKNDEIVMDIIAEFNHYHNISFVCDDICVIEEKLITNEELDKLYDKIENDNAPRIIK